MDRQLMAHYVERFSHMHEDELYVLHQKADGLTEEARDALMGVIAGRNIDIAKMARDIVTQDRAIETKLQQTEERKEKRAAKWGKILGIAAIPIIVIGVIANPSRASETLAKSLGASIALGLLCGLIYGIRKVLKK